MRMNGLVYVGNGRDPRSSRVSSVATTQPTSSSPRLDDARPEEEERGDPHQRGVEAEDARRRSPPASNFSSRAVARPIAEPATAPAAISGELTAIPSAKHAPVRAFSWKNTWPIPRNTARTGDGIASEYRERALGSMVLTR